MKRWKKGNKNEARMHHHIKNWLLYTIKRTEKKTKWQKQNIKGNNNNREKKHRHFNSESKNKLSLIFLCEKWSSIIFQWQITESKNKWNKKAMKTQIAHAISYYSFQKMSWNFSRINKRCQHNLYDDLHWKTIHVNIKSSLETITQCQLNGPE